MQAIKGRERRRRRIGGVADENEKKKRNKGEGDQIAGVGGGATEGEQSNNIYLSTVLELMVVWLWFAQGVASSASRERRRVCERSGWNRGSMHCWCEWGGQHTSFRPLLAPVEKNREFAVLSDQTTCSDTCRLGQKDGERDPQSSFLLALGTFQATTQLYCLERRHFEILKTRYPNLQMVSLKTIARERERVSLCPVEATILYRQRSLRRCISLSSQEQNKFSISYKIGHPQGDAVGGVTWQTSHP